MQLDLFDGRPEQFHCGCDYGCQDIREPDPRLPVGTGPFCKYHNHELLTLLHRAELARQGRIPIIFIGSPNSDLYQGIIESGGHICD